MRTLVATLLFGSLTAAQTFIVDAAGGPGSHFTSLGTAAASVPSGSTLLVRAGTYYPFAIDQKSLTVLGDPGAAVVIWTPLEVKNLLAHQQVTLQGLQMSGLFSYPNLHCKDNLGTVLVDGCRPPANQGLQCVVENCADIRIHDCDFFGGSSPLVVQDGNVRASQSSFRTLTYSAIQILDGFVELADVTVSGGPGGAPVWMLNGDLRLLGRSDLRVGSSTMPGSGPVLSGSGAVRLDPNVILSTASGTPIGAGLAVTTRSMPVVAASAGTPGGSASASLEGPGTGIGALVVGLPALPTTIVPGVDPGVMLPGTEIVMAIGSLAAPLTATYSVPPVPGLRAVRVAWQGASFDPLSGLQMSNGVTYVHW